MLSKRGDIVLVPFPFTNLVDFKLRPCLVVFDNQKDHDFIVLPITSQISRKNAYKIDNDSLSKGKLPVVSYIRYDKVTTLDKSLIKMNVAALKVDILNVVIDKFKGLF